MAECRQRWGIAHRSHGCIEDAPDEDHVHHCSCGAINAAGLELKPACIGGGVPHAFVPGKVDDSEVSMLWCDTCGEATFDKSRSQARIWIEA